MEFIGFLNYTVINVSFSTLFLHAFVTDIKIDFNLFPKHQKKKKQPPEGHKTVVISPVVVEKDLCKSLCFQNFCTTLLTKDCCGVCLLHKCFHLRI